MQFQSDARSTKLDLLFALFTTKIYQQDSPQPSTCCGAVMPTPAICMQARAAMAPQNLDLYESCWLSLTGYSQCSYRPRIESGVPREVHNPFCYYLRGIWMSV